MKIHILIILGLVLGCSFTGCNTISGAGHDVSAAGRGVSNGANAVKSSL